MANKYQIAARNRWKDIKARVSPEAISERMSKLALLKHAKTTPAQRKRQAKIMVKARAGK
ncbi:MAG: hypothetical protein WC767_03690 [Candidatus Paceibacterota bacterium]|jgi:hypothetical protein